MKDDKTDDSSDIAQVHQAGDDKAEQEARSIEYQEKAEQLLKLHRQDKVITRNPTLLIGILTLYLFLVYTVATIGMLASSGHHATTSEIFLVVSVLLLVPVPISVIWYFLRIGFKRKLPKKVEDKQNLLVRLTQSSHGRILVRLGNSLIFKLLALVMAVYTVTLAIKDIFPRRPRLSLGIIVLYMAFFVVLVASEVVRQLTSATQRDIKEIWEFNELVRGAMRPIGDVIPVMSKRHEELAERHEKLAEAHIKTNEANLAAIVELNKFVRAVANIPEPDQAEGGSEEPPPP